MSFIFILFVCVIFGQLSLGAKFGLVVLFLFFFACGGLVGPRVTGTPAILDCLVLYQISINDSGQTTVASRTRDETSRRDETRRSAREGD